MTEPTFNAVIEGIYEADRERAGFKLVHVEVQENATHIFDGAYSFALRAADQQEDEKQPKLEVIVESLTFCKGLIIPWAQGGIKSVLKRPRMVCLDDKRVFVESNVITKDQQYQRGIKGLIQGAQYIFRGTSFQLLYAKAMQELAEVQKT